MLIQGSVFPEFLDTLTIPTVYKDGEILSSDSYIDMRTKEVSVVNVFMNTKLRSGTILEVNFMYGGPGSIEGRYRMISFTQMDAETQKAWSGWVNLVVVLCIIDLGLLLLGSFFSWRERRKWYDNIEMDGAIPVNTPGRKMVWNRIEYGLRKNLPLWSGWDVFDVALRILMLIFTQNHFNHYNSPDLDTPGIRRGRFETEINNILTVPWASATLRYEEKVMIFFQAMRKLATLLDEDSQLRQVGYVLVLLMFFRIVAYLRVHPRIAVLYKTIEVALDDLFHFFIVLGLLYGVLAFIGVWMFGAINGKFASFSDSVITQFEMLMGEYPWPESQTDQDFGLFFSYLNIYSLVVFFILLNFLLAIIVDSYASVKEAVNTCVIECNIFTDLVALTAYPVMQMIYKWPERGYLIRKLLALDVNFDFVNDEEEEGDSVVITSHALVKGKVFEDEDAAQRFLNYYLFFAPALDANADEEEGSLEHQRKLRALRNLDILRERLLEAALESGLVHVERPRHVKDPLVTQMETLRDHITNSIDGFTKEAVLLEAKLKKLEDARPAGHDGGKNVAGSNKVGIGDKSASAIYALTGTEAPVREDETKVTGVAQLHISEEEHKEAVNMIFGHFVQKKASASAEKMGEK
ncbi:unnamed protein product [Amoebophrya sp. A25]|nr:unnamed protein product [Amoebophrya sp. A25]|eukprot:GSA25T00005670001.1